MLGSDTGVVNGQRFTFPTRDSYNPPIVGMQTTGVPNVSPSMPPYIGGGAPVTGGTSVGGYGTADNNATMTAIAANNPHNLKVSPVWWAVGGLVLGLLLLKGVHWRDTTLGGFDERARVGAAREEASAEA